MTDAVKRGRNNRSRGHAVERDVARMLGGVRIGSDQGGVTSDVYVATTGCIYEVKSRRQETPKLISGAWDQVTRAAEKSGHDVGGVVLAYTPGGGHKRRFWLVTELLEED